VVRGLTEASEGNAIGIGMADVITLETARRMNPGPTYTNALTAGVVSAGRLPMVANTDRDAMIFAMMGLGKTTLDDLRTVHIKNTLELESIEVSRHYCDEMRSRKDLFESSFELLRMCFDEKGRMSIM
jgi:hypothetical protein